MPKKIKPKLLDTYKLEVIKVNEKKAEKLADEYVGSITWVTYNQKEEAWSEAFHQYMDELCKQDGVRV